MKKNPESTRLWTLLVLSFALFMISFQGNDTKATTYDGCVSCVLPKQDRLVLPVEKLFQDVKFVRKTRPHHNETLNVTDSFWEEQAVRILKLNRQARTTIITIASFEHKDLVLNWAASLLRCQTNLFVIFCLDRTLYHQLLEFGLDKHAVYAPPSWSQFKQRADTSKDSTYEYNQAKIRIQLEILKRDFWLLYSDAGSVFLSESILDHTITLLGSGCSKGQPTQCFGDLAYLVDRNEQLSTSLFLARPTQVVLNTLNQTMFTMQSDDQSAFNHVVTSVLNLRYDKVFRPLDKLLYANGETYFLKKANKNIGIEPFVVLTNNVHDVKMKREELEAAEMWFLRVEEK